MDLKWKQNVDEGSGMVSKSDLGNSGGDFSVAIKVSNRRLIYSSTAWFEGNEIRLEVSKGATTLYLDIKFISTTDKERKMNIEPGNNGKQSANLILSNFDNPLGSGFDNSPIFIFDNQKLYLSLWAYRPNDDTPARKVELTIWGE